MKWLGAIANLALAAVWIALDLPALALASLAFAAVCGVIAATGFTGA